MFGCCVFDNVGSTWWPAAAGDLAKAAAALDEVEAALDRQRAATAHVRSTPECKCSRVPHVGLAVPGRGCKWCLICWRVVCAGVEDLRAQDTKLTAIAIQLDAITSRAREVRLERYATRALLRTRARWSLTHGTGAPPICSRKQLHRISVCEQSIASMMPKEAADEDAARQLAAEVARMQPGSYVVQRCRGACSVACGKC